MALVSPTPALVLEFKDNRLAGLLREVREAVEECDDPTTLRRFGIALKQQHDVARGKGFDLQSKQGNRTW